MREEKVRSNYNRLTDYELATLAGRVVKAMREPHTAEVFPDPVPGIDELGILVEDYINKHEVASRGGSTLEISLKNESRETLLAALRSLAGYVNEKARGQLSLLLSTGLHLVSQPVKTQVPAIPEEVKLRDGALSGQIKVSFRPVRSSWIYEIQIGKESEEEGQIDWKEKVSTTLSRGTVIGNLLSGSRHFVCVRAINGRGKGDWSEPVSMIVR